MELGSKNQDICTTEEIVRIVAYISGTAPPQGKARDILKSLGAVKKYNIYKAPSSEIWKWAVREHGYILEQRKISDIYELLSRSQDYYEEHYMSNPG